MIERILMKSVNRKLFYAVIILILLFAQLNSDMAQSRITAFPGAEGFGRFSTGGRGGDVYHVTNLNDDGEGSLRYGIEKMKGPRTIVFNLSGNIILKKSLTVSKPNLTIAGQTAPGEGITLCNYSFLVSADNIIVRYIRSRLGDKSDGDSDAISINRGSNIIFDHVSASWSIDETFSCQSGKADSITVQWCMITESLRNSHHHKGAHGYGGIIGSIQQSFHHNLYAHHSSRSPKVTGRRHCEVDFRNNVIYNWGYNNCYDGTSSYMNWTKNYYKPGPGTKESVRHRIFQLSDAQIAGGPGNEGNSPGDSYKYETSLYAEENYIDGYPDVTADNWNGGIDFTNGANEERNRAHKPFDFPPITELSAIEVYPLVVANAGASLVRDILDARIADEVLTGTVHFGNGGIIDSQNDVGGWPALKTLPAPKDSDRDGMPDEWEIKNGLNPDNPDDRNGDMNKDGYTNLEDYLNNIVITEKK
ncbi:MAG TPA: hypothetical protein PLZ15_02115 [Melioribacteraceae bacterium]|nr:hypothetical protein [Melioribacteraceae bacterium]